MNSLLIVLCYINLILISNFIYPFNNKFYRANKFIDVNEEYFEDSFKGKHYFLDNKRKRDSNTSKTLDNSVASAKSQNCDRTSSIKEKR